MTIKELIEALQQMPEDIQVELYDVELYDGSICGEYHTVSEIVRRPETNTVVIL